MGVSGDTRDGYRLAPHRVCLPRVDRFLEGSPNPAVHTLDAPVTASAAFDLTYAIAETPGFIEIEAATQQEIVFEVANANLPVQWTLRLGSVPEGLLFRSEGLITGVPFEAGDFPLEIRVTDAIGLEATVGLTLRIEPPGLGAEDLAAPFPPPDGFHDESPARLPRSERE